MKVFRTSRQDFHDVLTCFCGPTHSRTLPDDLLRIILEMSGLLKIGARSIRFNIFFPPIEYKACLNIVRQRNERRVAVRRAGGLLPFDASIEKIRPVG